MLLSVERPHRGSLCRWMSRGHAAALYGLEHPVPPASDWNMCKRAIVVPQELGRTLFAPRKRAAWACQFLFSSHSIRSRRGYQISK